MGNIQQVPYQQIFLKQDRSLNSDKQLVDPNLFIQQILIYLETDSLFMCRLVCREWNYMILQVEDLSISISDDVSKNHIKSFNLAMKRGVLNNVTHLSMAKMFNEHIGRYLKKLKSITVWKKGTSEKVTFQCEHLQGIENLSEIVFKGSEVTSPELMRNHTKLKRVEVRNLKCENNLWDNIIAPLEQLELFSVYIRDEHWKKLMTHIKSSLKDLKIGNTFFKSLNEISELTNLESLTINEMIIAHSDYFQFISKLKKLKRLKMQSNHLTSDKCLELSSLENITKLDMSNNRIESVSFISGMSCIQSLKLRDNNIGNEGCLLISTLLTITKLSLTGNNISNQGVIHLSKLINLTSLDLGNNNINNVDSITTHVTNLKKLRLYVNEISSIDVSKLLNLRVLDLNSNSTTSIKGLENMKQLQTLLLFGSKLPDHLFTNESYFPNLECLDLQNCTNIDLKVFTKENYPKLTYFVSGTRDLFSWRF